MQESRHLLHDPAGNPCVGNAAASRWRQFGAFNRLPDRSTARTQYKRCLTPGSALDGDEVWSLTRLATIQAGPPRRAAVWQPGTKGALFRDQWVVRPIRTRSFHPHPGTFRPSISRSSPKTTPGQALTHALLYRTVTLTANLWVSPFTKLAKSHEWWRDGG